MTKTVVIVQSNYIPWKGYFDLVNLADEFILFDDVQYTRRDWRNRNKIKTPGGVKWLTIPVKVKGRYLQKIKDVVVSDSMWRQRHWRSIVHSYARAECFPRYRDLFEELYLGSDQVFLSQINYQFLTAICGILGIDTRISWSMDYSLVEGKTERLVALCRQAGATRYLSGPSARCYLDEALFRAAGIVVDYMDYSGYPPYKQLYPPFEPGVSVLDLIFNMGPRATDYMKSF